MKYSLTLLTALFCVLGTAVAAGAENVRIKFGAAAYEDARGIGMQQPEGTACRGNTFWVADTGNSRLLRYGYKDRNLNPEAEFPLPKSVPTAIQVNSKGEVYVLDSRDRRIARLNALGQPQGHLQARGKSGSTEVVPKSFTIDGEDNIHILDSFSGRVLVVGPDGKFIREIPFPAGYGFFSALAVDAQGTIFLVDSVEAAIYSAAANAEEFTLLTEDLKEFVNFPTSLAVDSKRGLIYLVDQYGSGLAVLGRNGAFLGRKIGMGWKENLLHYPAQVCLSDEGHLFIADRNNNRAQLFTISE